MPDGRTSLQLTPLELIHRLGQLLTPPRKHRHRYYGVFAPNAPLRTSVAALARADTDTDADNDTPEPAAAPATAHSRPSHVYLWAILLARIYEISPLICSHCGAPVRIVAFITETAPIQRILQHIGEPHEPPPLRPPRGPPPEEAFDAQSVCLDEDLNQDRYEFEPDQRQSW